MSGYSTALRQRISRPGDREEREAEQMATRAWSRGKERLGSHAFRPHRDSDALPNGRPLDPATRDHFEPRFGLDLSHVRIHADDEAANAAHAVRARAFTRGSDVVFGRGQYRPSTSEGQSLIAHELAHTFQSSDAILRQPETEPAWEQDEDSDLYYRTRAEAERRRARLEEAGEWSELRVVSFERNGATFWRVEMRGRRQRTQTSTTTGTTAADAGAASGSSPDAGAATSTTAAGTAPAATGTSTTTGGRTRVFSLTFDDGPHTAPLGTGVNRTEKVLDTLQAKGVRGGFFIQTGVANRGGNAIGRALVARMHTDGHRVGIHTGGTTDHESHPSAERAGRLTSELTAAKSYIRAQTGATPDLVRPPFGASNAAVRNVYASLNLTNVLWDIDGDKPPASNLTALKARLNSSSARDPGIPAVHARGWTATTPSRPKIVVLYHDIRAATANNVGPLIDHIRATVSSLTGGRDTADFAPP
jgi:peptidoglycan/xylan/chitin deacetylase (PgdA/CDA1 family)